MASLIDLPNDIVMSIIDLVHVEDIISLSSCHKRIRLLSVGVLKE